MKPTPRNTPTNQTSQASSGRELTHEETLAWIAERRAWRRARKTEPIWARAVTVDEIGKEIQTADRAIEKAREGAWICVGVANEPWFQSLEKIAAKYDRGTTAMKDFVFDDKPREYHQFQPKPNVVNWAARIDAPELAGFSVRPGYDPSTPLHSPSGGYVIKGDVDDPYLDQPDNVWLVQEALFLLTYEFLPEDSTAQGQSKTGDVP